MKIHWPRFKWPNCHLISLYPVPPVNEMLLNVLDQPAEMLSARTWVEFRLNLSESGCGAPISLHVCRIWPWASKSHPPREKLHFALCSLQWFRGLQMPAGMLEEPWPQPRRNRWCVRSHPPHQEEFDYHITGKMQSCRQGPTTSRHRISPRKKKKEKKKPNNNQPTRFWTESMMFLKSKSS